MAFPAIIWRRQRKTIKLLETKNTTYAIATQYHLTTIFRDNEKIKTFTREIHHDGVTYGEYVMLHEFDRKHGY